MRISYVELCQTFESILSQFGFDEEGAKLSATLFAKASLDGVASHGLNRFPTYLKFVQEGHIDPRAKPESLWSNGFFERFDGHFGPGNLNAHFAMEKAIKMAKNFGMGAVALRQTNHWMRAGNYGWQAVEAGCIGICFSNTIPNMPAWGGSQPLLGNNPLVIAVPRKAGPLVLDMAMSQFAYGKMQAYARAGQEMPFEAGFDEAGNLTKDPKTIIDRHLALPIGLWKGAGLSLMLDVLAALLSEGQAAYQVGKRKKETGLSQFFLCFYLPKLGLDFSDEILDGLIDNFSQTEVFDDKEVRYPGEGTLKTRKENLEKGVPVDPEIWQQVLELSKG
ncbi:3-dehydro-L-gulonate 2-dehydrogenase [Pararhodonellum marinum]|uniref:3-dehydro-L-gulonate 2-dehydrogenase n=1 Tax=Pararhodonellum marinum TaxID=2755358 RepID=UPI001890AB1D|nr:3-dehydro-L-gulonate 2-dehydrogenase [Pararhodonellum marinum]